MMMVTFHLSNVEFVMWHSSAGEGLILLFYFFTVDICLSPVFLVILHDFWTM